MKTIFSFLIALIVTLAMAQENQKDYSEAYHLIEIWLDAQKDYEQLPGITMAIVEDQKIIWSDAFGMANTGQNVEATPQTLGSICSISKLFTSTAIMKLYDEGKLRLDDRVEDILPWYDLKQQFPGSGPITIRSLLTHSSGLPREANAPYWTGPDFPFPPQTAVKEGLSEQETLYPASTYFQYSNLGLTLLGEIIEEVSGQPYQEYISNNILDPLGLTSTHPFMPEDKYGKELAIGYSAMTRNGNRDQVRLFDAKGITAAAGFSSNVEDLGRFASWQFRLRDTTNTEILKSSTLKNMHNIHWMDPDFKTSWGLGFAVYKGPDNKKWVGHGGSCPGYRSSLQLNLKDKRAFVTMINASGTNPSKYNMAANAILNKVKSNIEAAPENEKKENVDLADYQGYYSAQPWWSEYYISPWEGMLVELPLPADDPAEAMTFYKHIEGDTFRRIRDDQELGETLTFERDETGNVIRSWSHGNYSVKIRN